jgi:glutamine synthetase
MIDMAKKQILPAVIGYTKTLADTVISVKEAGADASVQAELLSDVSKKLAEAKAALSVLEEKVAETSSISEAKALAFFFKDEIFVAMQNLRKPVDELEMLVDKSVWPMPTYGDLIFEV